LYIEPFDESKFPSETLAELLLLKLLMQNGSSFSMFSFILRLPLFFGLIDGLPFLCLPDEDTGLWFLVIAKFEEFTEIGFVSKTLKGDMCYMLSLLKSPKLDFLELLISGE
jgi:hypothetical protein